MQDITKNTGIIVEQPRDTDYIAGLESGVAFQSVLAGGDWTPHLPSDERQSGRFTDTMACVTFSALNVIEAQFNLAIAQGRLRTDVLIWLQDNGYMEDGATHVNFADRAIAKLSGTGRNGNSLVNVVDAIRKYGLVPEKDWAYDRDTFDWDTYYAEVPDWVVAKGKEFLRVVGTIVYEWIPNNPIQRATPDVIAHHLEQAPIQIATAVCPPWNTEAVIAACGLSVCHATTLYAVVSGQFFRDFDHYVPTRKRLALDYPIPWLLKIVLTLNEAPKPAPTAPPAPAPAPKPPAFKHQFGTDIHIGDRNAEVVALQKALAIAGHFPAAVAPTGYYGNITAKAVLAFQRANHVATEAELSQLNGKVVGAKTRAALNAKFA